MVYICIEGGEGVGKTTQTKKLADWLEAQGHKIVRTKEPGTPLSPLTMQLRSLMLDNQYAGEMTPLARELISQAIRSVHLQQVIAPAIQGQCDYIVQDRGIFSGLAYGLACGNDFNFLVDMALRAVAASLPERNAFRMYDILIYLRGDPKAGLARAQATKQEFAAGDAMELRGPDFMMTVAENMNAQVDIFGAKVIEIDGKDVEQVFEEIVAIVSKQENK